MQANSLESGKTLWSDLYEIKPGVKEIQELAAAISIKNVTSTPGLTAKEHGDDVLAHACWFLRDTLTFIKLENAVSHGNAGRTLKIVKLWAYMFRGAGLYNYAWEALELPEGLKKNLEMSWFGKAGA
ncbi:hypothetical protein FRC05_007980, partial [Tulasnella sp. 425]